VGDTDGVMMSGGKMMMMKDGKAVGPMQTNMRMSNGASVMLDGTIMLGGKLMQMKEGQMMMMDGTMMEGESR
jgi:hypothetical protein